MSFGYCNFVACCFMYCLLCSDAVIVDYDLVGWFVCGGVRYFCLLFDVLFLCNCMCYMFCNSVAYCGSCSHICTDLCL